jgi:hypothetical protein
MTILYKNTRKYIGTLFMFHFENIYDSIMFMVSWKSNLKNFSIIKLGNKYVLNWSANIFFKPIFTLQVKYILIRMWKRWKATLHFRAPLNFQNKIVIFYLLTTYLKAIK